MKPLTSIFKIILILQFLASPAGAQSGYQQLGSGYQQITPQFDQGGGGQQMQINLDRTLNQMMVQVPGNAVSFDQLQSVISQAPGVENLIVQFPNMAQWQTSPAELLQLHQQYTQAAGGLGFGAGGLNIPALIFSSVVSQAGLSGDITSQAGAIAMLPITNLKNAMGDTLSPILQQMGIQHAALDSWMPTWLSDMFTAIYNFVMPYFTATADWVKSFF